MCVCVCACVRVCVCVCVCHSMCVCMCACACRARSCVYVCVCVCVCITQSQLHYRPVSPLFTRARECVMYMYVCIHSMYIHIYTHHGGLQLCRSPTTQQSQKLGPELERWRTDCGTVRIVVCHCVRSHTSAIGLGFRFQVSGFKLIGWPEA